MIQYDSIFILNKILLKFIILNYYYLFLTKKNYEDVNILMFPTYNKITFFYKKNIYIIYDFIIILSFIFYYKIFIFILFLIIKPFLFLIKLELNLVYII